MEAQDGPTEETMGSDIGSAEGERVRQLERQLQELRDQLAATRTVLLG